MPLILEGGRIPPRWLLERKAHRSLSSSAANVRIAFLNNMPDAALEDTELQFFDLLADASSETNICLKLFSVTGVSRTERGQRHLNDFYYGLDELWANRFDGIIITGTEPRQPELRDEPYWPALSQVFDWAERNTSAAILSCLAAHASVLHGDGVPRHRLPDKQFGVFQLSKHLSHELISGAAQTLRFPHSRWNEVRSDELSACGYSVLTKSADGTVDSFVKKKRESLFLHFQGHPEYAADTLLKEYRRDIRRFIRRERDTYPTMPKDYFDAASERLVLDFRQMAMADSREQLMESFPEAALAATLERSWRTSATDIYLNWLRYLVARKAEMPKFSVVPSAHDEIQTKITAQP